MNKIKFSGLLAAPLLMLALSAPGHADDSSGPTTCKDGTTSATTGRGACSGHGGVQKMPAAAAAAAPLAPASPGGASAPAATTPAVSGGATCKDGTTSATSGRGACSGHGGVQKKSTTPAAAAASAPTPAPAPMATASPGGASAPAASTAMSASAPTATAGNMDPTGATAKCTDGTYSKAKTHKGACSHHGGVATWLTTQ